MELEVDVLYKTDMTAAMMEAGHEPDLETCERRSMTFYRIDAIAPFLDSEKYLEYCAIYVGGMEWITPLSYDEMVVKIKEVDNE